MSWIRVSCLLALVAAGLSSPGARAQEVTLVPIGWRDKSDPPDQLPVHQGVDPVELPEGLKASDQIGYVLSKVMLDQSGKVLEEIRHATSDACLDAVRRAEKNAKWLPGKRDRKPVVTAITYAYIFNPASAGANLADATPRLLEVDIGYLPVKAFALNPPASESKAPGTGGKSGTRELDVRKKSPGSTAASPPEPVVVKAEITVGLNGRITSVEGVPDDYTRAVNIAAKNWRFAPARQKGEPVEAKISADFILAVRRGGETEGIDIPPKVIMQVKPVYPLAMRISGMRAEVVLDFVVDIEGRVVHAGVVRSSNPLFDEAAIEAVRKWRFRPGIKNGRPVNTRMQVPIMFSIEGELGGGSGPFVMKKKGDLSKLPEAYRYDTPPVPVNYLPPVYPYPLLREGVKGRAVVAFMVNEKGAVVRSELQEASSPEFGAALVAAVEAFQFKPALKNGVPCPAMMLYQEDFEGDGLAQFVGDEGTKLLRQEKKKPQSIHGADDLDDKLRPSFRKPPLFPLNAKSDTGRANVEFIIDETGRARLPRIVSASEDVFGYAAVQAASTWRFEPPKVGGKPAAVRVRVPFNFTSVEKGK
ncbi:MAG: TonB family protein [Opitutaceae bacterium]|nr:TonB family protein [Opitutaceae bacterium]